MFTTFTTNFKRPADLPEQETHIIPFSGKRAKTQPTFGPKCEPVPDTLKKRLELLSQSYYNSHMRNLNILEDKTERLYGLMTNYEGHNICWIQPTRVRNNTPDVEYDRYIKKINDLGTQHRSFNDIKVGLDCVAQYEVDSHWYRGLVVEQEPDGRWLVLFVDYGNCQVCTCEQIKQPIFDPECDHFHAPLQAICCRLYNIIPNLPSLQGKIDTYFDCFYSRNAHIFLEVQVRTIRPDYVVECDVFLRKKDINRDKTQHRLFRRHIGQRLVDAKVAKFADEKAAHAVRETDPIEIN